MKLGKLIEGVSKKIDSPLSDAEIKHVSINSKDIKEKSLFVAIEGAKVDGHEFIGDALKKGAVAAIADKQKTLLKNANNIITVNDTRKALSVVAKNFYGSPSEKLKVVGITGTNGKTTTAFLVESVFNHSDMPCGVIGTIEYRIGQKSIPADRTTPDALYTHELLCEMLKNGLKAVSMEVSSHALDQKRVDDIFFDTAIFTNITHEHLDYHRDLKAYLAAKAKIFSNLKNGGFAVINTDDKAVRKCIRKFSLPRYVTYGLGDDADISAEIKNADLRGSVFDVKIRKIDAFQVNTKLAGLHNVSNILAAAAAGYVNGIDLRLIKKGVEAVHSVKGRLEPVAHKQGFKVFVDFAHTHNALENVLSFLSAMKKRSIITVFGCGGDRDREKRPLMGRVAQRFSDFVIITSDNPRSEDPRAIASEIEKGMEKDKARYEVILDRKEAIESALKKAKTGDIVLIAGKGHEMTQIIGDKETPFDDRCVAEEALNHDDK